MRSSLRNLVVAICRLKGSPTLRLDYIVTLAKCQPSG